MERRRGGEDKKERGRDGRGREERVDNATQGHLIRIPPQACRGRYDSVKEKEWKREGRGDRGEGEKREGRDGKEKGRSKKRVEEEKETRCEPILSVPMRGDQREGREVRGSGRKGEKGGREEGREGREGGEEERGGEKKSIERDHLVCVH